MTRFFQILSLLILLLSAPALATESTTFVRRYPTNTAVKVLTANGQATNSTLQASPSTLIGRYSAGFGQIQEIQLGSGLSLSGNALSSSGGTPGGSPTQIQYNNSGSFGGVTGSSVSGSQVTFGAVSATDATFSVIDVNGGVIDGTRIGSSSAADATFSSFSAFFPTASTGVRGTGGDGIITFTEMQSSGTKRYLSFDLVNNSRITARANRPTFLWIGNDVTDTFWTSFSANGNSFVDSSSNAPTAYAANSLYAEGTNDWQWRAGGSSNAGANYLSLFSFAKNANVLEADKTTGNFDFNNGSLTDIGGVSATEATFTSLQASRIGNVSAGDATFSAFTVSSSTGVKGTASSGKLTLQGQATNKRAITIDLDGATYNSFSSGDGAPTADITIDSSINYPTTEPYGRSTANWKFKGGWLGLHGTDWTGMGISTDNAGSPIEFIWANDQFNWVAGTTGSGFSGGGELGFFIGAEENGVWAAYPIFLYAREDEEVVTSIDGAFAISAGIVDQTHGGSTPYYSYFKGSTSQAADFTYTLPVSIPSGSNYAVTASTISSNSLQLAFSTSLNGIQIGASSPTDATFTSVQAQKIGNVSAGEATFSVINGTRIGSSSTMDATFSAINVPGVGSNSQAFGLGANAQDDSLAFGNNANATNSGAAPSLCIGNNCSAIDYSTVIGPSSSGAGSDLVFGASASSDLGFSVVGGQGANAGAIQCVVLGFLANGDGTRAIAIGNQADVQSGSTPAIAIGPASVISNSADRVILLGPNLSSTFSDVIGLGGGQAATESNQFWVGGAGTNGFTITTFTLGEGITSTTATSPSGTTVLTATGGSGSNNAARDMVIRGGTPTGSSTTGGNIRFETPSTGSSGSTPQNQSERIRIARGGNIGVATTTPTYTFDVTGSIRATTSLNSPIIEASTVIRSAGTVGNTQSFLGKATNVGCMILRDTDDAGWTECFALNGVLSCTIDADGVCDGA